MDPERAIGASDLRSATFQPVSYGIDWKTIAGISLLATLYLLLPTGMYPLLVLDEARHAGIVHDMWMAHQYVVPRVDGMPLLDGAPLHRWLTLLFLWAFGSSEWALRLPSALWAGLTLAAMSRLLLPWSGSRSLVTLCAVMLLQPAVMFAGRLAVPDMLNVFMLTLACGSFMQAALHAERGLRPETWMVAAWVTTGLLGLGAGPLAMFVPVAVTSLWLLVRRRLGVLRTLCWSPAVAAVLMVVPWFCVVSVGNPGIVAAMLDASWWPLWTPAAATSLGAWSGLRGGLLFASILPLAVCLYRYRDPARHAALHTPIAGFMAAWLAVLLPLHPLVAMTAVGTAAFMAVPLMYFSALALAPVKTATRGGQALAWLLYCLTAVGAAWVVLETLAPRASAIPPVARAVADHYLAATDKVIMLDRYDYEFNFYLRSSKLVFVAAQWERTGDASAPRWMRELAESGRHGQKTAQHMLLTHDAFLERLCGRRVVNLWVIADVAAPQRHPILADLTVLSGTGKVRAWYLDSEDQPPAGCDLNQSGRGG